MLVASSVTVNVSGVGVVLTKYSLVTVIPLGSAPVVVNLTTSPAVNP